MKEELEKGVLVVSRQLGVLSLDSAAVRLLGREFGPARNFPLEDVFFENDFEFARETVLKAIASGKPADGGTGRVHRKAGEPVLCEYSAQPLFIEAGEIVGAVLSLKRINEIKKNRIEEPPQTPCLSRQMDYRHLYEELPEGVFTVDKNRRITSFNRTAENITGYKRERAIGRHCWEIFRSDRCHADCPMAAAMETGERYLDQEVRTINRGGEQTLVMVNVNVLRDKDGNTLGAVETFRPMPLATEVLPSMRPASGFSGIIGNSPSMQRLFSMLPDIAASEASVIVCGETGTGKDLLAQAIHRLSKRRKGPFVAVNCSALAETLLESELFGHEKGAFTGAEKSKPGRFELAEGGTLFLDEIGDLKSSLQVKLLRVLEQREFERVGGTRTIPFDARVVAATNADLKEALKSGRFRDDLFYRLRTVAITLPPLRERIEDIPLLANHFIRKFNEKFGKRVRSLDPKVLRHFEEYHWPGNIRELERCIEHAFVFVKGPVIFPQYLPEFENSPQSSRLFKNMPHPAENLKDKETILRALEQADGHRQKAAALLGISRTSMWRRMKEMELL